MHKDSLTILDDLTDEQAGKLFKAIRAHQEGEIIELDALTKIAFNPFKNQFLRDNEKYEETVNRNKINGSKGGRPKSKPNPEEPKEPSGFIGNPEEPKKADSGSKSDSDSGSKSKRFTPPSVGDAQSYFQERGFGEKGVGQRFVDHYSANGWMRGKNKIKDWKACVRTWCGNMKPVPSASKPIKQVKYDINRDFDLL